MESQVSQDNNLISSEGNAEIESSIDKDNSQIKLDEKGNTNHK